jgi:DNA-binding GntR family transcriptional regulator
MNWSKKPMTERIRHLSLAEQVYHRLLDKIISGKLPEGHKLSEEAICADLGVSRTPAREALMMLDRDKLIERIPRRGCFVRKFDRAEVADIFECRRLLECLALEQGFDNIPEKELLKLKSLLETPGGASRKKSLQVDEDLHELIINSCPNKTLRGTVRQIVKRSSPLRSWRAFGSTDIKILNRERLEIINSLLEKDKDKSIKLLGSHISQGIRTLVNTES